MDKENIFYDTEYRFSYYSSPKKSSKALLFIGGNGTSVKFWKHQVKFFEQAGWKCVVMDYNYDKKNFKSHYQYTHRQFLHLLSKLGLEKVVLIGHSYGGNNAMFIAAHSPEKVEKLVLVNTNTSYPMTKLDFLLYSLNEFIAKGLFLILSVFRIDYMISKKYFEEGRKRYRNFKDFLKDNPFQAKRFSCSKYSVNYSLEEDVKKIKCKSLMIEGISDPLVKKKDAFSLRKKIKGSKLKLLQGSHLLPLSKPDKLNKLVSTFIKNGK